MKEVWKFELRLALDFTLDMPTGARLLHVGSQDGESMLWAEVNPQNDRERRQFHCHGTGHEVPEDGRSYIGTVVEPTWVWHFYEGKNGQCGLHGCAPDEA